ncbi:MAG: glycoside hydrolase family 3 protein [Candidatus Limnocylindria bacterium]
MQPSASSPTPSTRRPPSPAPTAVGPDLRIKIGQMLLVGFRGTSVDAGSQVVRDISEHSLGGVVLFDVDMPTRTPSRNVESPDQLRRLVADLQAAAATTTAGIPLLVAIDQEGGQVARLDPDHGFPATESAAQLGARGDSAYTESNATALATTLAAAGINLNLAPVVDLDVNPANPIIGELDRSYSADADVVVEHALAFIRGHHAAGVRTALKHFPGHGSAAGDTHAGMVDVTNAWSDVELVPFARIIDAGTADAIVTAHVFDATIDADRPATLSTATINGMLRQSLGYDGVVISDDMQMGAIRDAFGYEEAVALAIEAGVDILTIANQQVFEEGIVARTIEIIGDHVASGRIEEARIDESHRRIRALKETLG